MDTKIECDGDKGEMHSSSSPPVPVTTNNDLNAASESSKDMNKGGVHDIAGDLDSDAKKEEEVPAPVGEDDPAPLNEDVPLAVQDPRESSEDTNQGAVHDIAGDLDSDANKEEAVPAPVGEDVPLAVQDPRESSEDTNQGGVHDIAGYLDSDAKKEEDVPAPVDVPLAVQDPRIEQESRKMADRKGKGKMYPDDDGDKGEICESSSPPITTNYNAQDLQDKARLGEASEVVKVRIFEEISEIKRYEYSLLKKKSLQARYWYGSVFFMANLVAWYLRDYGRRFSHQFQYLRSCGVDGADCLDTFGVLRISLGCFMFFFTMFITSCHATKLYEVRNGWHSRWWLLKSLLLLACVVIPFMIPSDFMLLYGELARVGAGLFLILQLLSMIGFINWWNNYWTPDESKKRSSFLGILISTILYIASLFGVGVMYWRYVPNSACIPNLFLITSTGVLLLVMWAISLHIEVNRGLLSTGIMTAYLVFLCWSAIRSEPAIEKCIPVNQSKHDDWTTIVGFLIAIGAIVWATFSTGIDSKTFQFRKDEIRQVDDVPYSYGVFHLIFSLGAMYFAMLFISWKMNNSARKWSMDAGWASTWIKIVNEWLAAIFYCWKLIYPAIRKTKVMHLELSSA